MDNIDWTKNVRPGYRLKKLEMTNWGTFDSSDGRVYSLAPDGRTALLVGQNGSGKSTVVDALLTLLVQPGIRNYNVAAGAKKRERDERSYIRGACGRSSDDELGSVTDYLRPHDKHYSVLLACFERIASGDAFTLVQVLQINAAGDVDKTYAFSDRERGIAQDLNGLTRGQRIRTQLMERGFQATHSYTEYAAWLARVARFRPKAMDIFNQTVAVKDIQSLNRFIREHMLESHPWRERVEGLLAHFTQLSQAHQILVKARRQIEMLEPIERSLEQLRAFSSDAHQCQQQLDAIDSFFRTQELEWLQPHLAGMVEDGEKARRSKLELQCEIDSLEDAQRALKNDIEKSGGERLRQLPLMIETQQALLNAKQRERQRLLTSLKILGESLACDGRDEFNQLPDRMQAVRRQLIDQSSLVAEQRLAWAREHSEIQTAIQEEQTQLEALSRQPGHLPAWLSELRSSIAADLAVPESELAFACELMSVAPDQSEWQPVIEVVLRRLAFSMLVPHRYYRQFSRYVERTRLADARGRGQRLVYACVPEHVATVDSLHPQPDSLVHKLVLRESHPLADWLRGELSRRFDFQCCETLEEFQQTSGPAITRSRHIKFESQHHEKDDRPPRGDQQPWILGWDNAQRAQDLKMSLEEWRQRDAEMRHRIDDLESESRLISRKMAAVDSVLGIPDFDLIDTKRHQAAITELEAERVAIENSNSTARQLRQRLENIMARRQAAQNQRDAQVAAESECERECQRSQDRLMRHRHVLDQRQRDGSLAEHQSAFDSLASNLGSRLSGLHGSADFTELQHTYSNEIQTRLNQIHQRADPLRAEAVRCMQRFLSENPDQRNDLQADLQYGEGFIGLLDQLRREDLPRHERRFRERLNEKVTDELGVLHASLHCERQEILTKIQVLNNSLEQLEYSPGTFMRLEPRDDGDREIRDFQTLLRDCLNDRFDGDPAADEARFNRIERLMRRFRDEERWRDKVTDVRRWFDFTARELDVLTGQERACYQDSSGQSGGEKAKLAFTILVAAIAYQFDIDPNLEEDERLHFVVVDEMFSKVDDRYADYALQLFEKFGLQLLIVAPLDAKARVTEPYVGCYLHTVKDDHSRRSDVISLTVGDYENAMAVGRAQATEPLASRPAAVKPR